VGLTTLAYGSRWLQTGLPGGTEPPGRRRSSRRWSRRRRRGRGAGRRRRGRGRRGRRGGCLGRLVLGDRGLEVLQRLAVLREVPSGLGRLEVGECLVYLRDRRVHGGVARCRW